MTHADYSRPSPSAGGHWFQAPRGHSGPARETPGSAWNPLRAPACSSVTSGLLAVPPPSRCWPGRLSCAAGRAAARDTRPSVPCRRSRGRPTRVACVSSNVAFSFVFDPLLVESADVEPTDVEADCV